MPAKSFCSRNYELLVRSPLRDRTYPVYGEYTAKWVLTEGKIGAFTLEAPVASCSLGGYSITDFEEDSLIEVRREVDGVEALVGDAPFFVKMISGRQDKNGKRVLYIEADSALVLTNRRINGYKSDAPQSKLTPRPCDDQMKYVMRNNYTNIAQNLVTGAVDAQRNLTGQMLIEADTTQVTAVYEAQINTQSAYDILGRIAKYSFSQGEPLFFEVIQTADFGAPFLLFQTRVGQRRTDRTLATGANPIVISETNGCISEYDLMFNWDDTATRLFSGGKGGGGGAKNFVVATDSTLVARLAVNPFALREAFFSSVSENPDTAKLQTEADTELQNRMAGPQLSGVLGERPAFVYGRDFFYGDRLTAFVEGVTIPSVYVESEEVTLSESKEEITIGFSTNPLRKLTGIAGFMQQVADYHRIARHRDTVEIP